MCATILDERVRPRGRPDERGARRWVSTCRQSRVDRGRDEAPERARRRRSKKLGNQRIRRSRARERRQGSSNAPSGEVKRRKGAVRGPGRPANGSSLVTNTSDVGESKEGAEAMVHGRPVRGGLREERLRKERIPEETRNRLNAVSRRLPRARHLVCLDGEEDGIHLERVSRSRTGNRSTVAPRAQPRVESTESDAYEGRS